MAATATATTSDATVLKAVLKSKHLLGYRQFCRAYRRAAAATDRELAKSEPARTTFFRWLHHDGLHGLPHPDHCQVLEAMLPRWDATELFQPWDGHTPITEPDHNPAIPAPRGDRPSAAAMAGVTGLYTSRAAFTHAMPTDTLFRGAGDIAAVGLSLNTICQQCSDQQLEELMRLVRVRLLFLDPHGDAITARTREEHHSPGHLAAWTEANINLARKLRDQAASSGSDNTELRVYDETIRFNIMVIDDLCITQPYLTHSRGVDSPTVVMTKQPGGMYHVFCAEFETLWEQGRPV